MSPTTPEPADRDTDKVAGGRGEGRVGRGGGCLWAGKRVRSGMKGGMMEPPRPAASPVAGGHERAVCSGGRGGQAAGRQRCYTAARSHGSCSVLCFDWVFLASLLTFPSRGSRLLRVRGEARFCELIRTQRRGGGCVCSESTANLK